MIEKRITAVTPVHTPRGLKRVVSQANSDLPDASVKTSLIYDPKNHRHTDRELGRYVNASEKNFRSTRHVALAGPDSTKVGTDFGVTMAAALNPVTHKVCVTLPQVPEFYNVDTTFVCDFSVSIFRASTPPVIACGCMT